MFSVFPPFKKQYLWKTNYNFVYPYWPVVSRFVNGVLDLPEGFSLWSSNVIRQLLSPFFSMRLRISYNAVSIPFIRWLIYMMWLLHSLIYLLNNACWRSYLQILYHILKIGSGFPEFHISLKRNKTFLKLQQFFPLLWAM